MKRIYFCTVLFVFVVVYSLSCQIYVSNAINRTIEHLNQASESRKNGDFAASAEHAHSAWSEWRGLTKRSSYVLADLTVAADVSISLSRVASVANTDDTDRFIEECTASILLLQHFLADNKNVLDGTLDIES
ncbi:MAG: DUF4363 family protein [Oscillospiraceae bacterium]|nr:DUF4363 family protein [Oscillospiraceae bacterium]